jgi:hypothetical protein
LFHASATALTASGRTPAATAAIWSSPSTLSPAESVSIGARMAPAFPAACENGTEEPDLLRRIKSSPGAVSLSTMLAEAEKLMAIASFNLPPGLFADVTAAALKEWRDQAMVESPSHMRSHPAELTIALLAALVFCRRREVTDVLVNLRLSTVHRIGARAERKVTTELVNAFRRVQGKEGLLPQVADASLARLMTRCARWCSRR